MARCLAESAAGGDQNRLPDALSAISLRVGTTTAALKIVSSEHRSDPDELVTYASGRVPAELISNFGAAGSHAILIKTESARVTTGIRIGNTGAGQNLPRVTAGCAKPIGDRAELPRTKTGGLAAAK